MRGSLFLCLAFCVLLFPFDNRVAANGGGGIDNRVKVNDGNAQEFSQRAFLEESLRDFGSDDYDCKKALNLFSEQLDGYSFAHYYRGVAYYQGICVKRSARSAYLEFEQGAKHGSLDAFYFMGLMKYGGVGVEQDVDGAGVIFKTLLDYKHDKTLILVSKLKGRGLIDESVLEDSISQELGKNQ